jgi:hypothetical protein
MTDEVKTESDVQPRLSPARSGARARFNEMLGEYFKTRAKQSVTLVPSWAAQLGVTPQYIRNQCSELKITSVLAAGDLESLSAEDLVDFLEHWLETKRAELAPPAPMDDPRLVALTAAQRAGEVSGTALHITSTGSKGGRSVTPSEWSQFEAKCAEGEREFRVAKMGARAARKGVR